MQILATDPAVVDTITITHVPVVREIIHVDAGAELRWDSHDTDHHILVMRGTCQVLGRRIEAGASAHVPAGFEHTVKAGAWGCTVLSLDGTSEAL
jgi:quercetin dioxygenase-like cupin family protein